MPKELAGTSVAILLFLNSMICNVGPWFVAWQDTGLASVNRPLFATVRGDAGLEYDVLSTSGWDSPGALDRTQSCLECMLMSQKKLECSLRSVGLSLKRQGLRTEIPFLRCASSSYRSIIAHYVSSRLMSWVLSMSSVFPICVRVQHICFSSPHVCISTRRVRVTSACVWSLPSSLIREAAARNIACETWSSTATAIRIDML